MEQQGMFCGPSHSICYLLRLNAKNNLDLIFEYSSWILESHPSDATRIFLTDSFSSLDCSAQLRVVQFLERYSAKSAHDFVVFLLDKKSKFTEIHNKYVKLLLAMAGSNVEYKSKLHSFLLDSAFYNADKLLSQCALSEFPEEKAILLGRVGRHREAIELLVIQLDSISKAEEYAESNYSSCPFIYLFLVEICLKMSRKEDSVKLDTACQLLNKYSSKISTLQVLEIYPKEASLSKISGYLSKSMMTQSNLSRSLQILKNLLRSLQLLRQEACMMLQSHRVNVHENSNCSICKKKIGNSVIAATYQGNLLAHFVCFRRESGKN